MTTRLGSWSGIVCAVASVAFLLGAFLGPSTPWRGDLAAYAAAFNPWAMILTVGPSFLIIPAFLGLMAAIHVAAPAHAKALTLLAFGIALVYAAILSANYYLQLAFVRRSLLAGETTWIGPLVMPDPRGVFWPIELLGYGVQGIALGVAAFAFAGSGLERWIRASFLLVAASGVLSLAAGLRGVTLTDPVFIAGGAAWGVGFPISGILTAIYFRRARGSSSSSSRRKPLAAWLPHLGDRADEVQLAATR